MQQVPWALYLCAIQFGACPSLLHVVPAGYHLKSSGVVLKSIDECTTTS